MDLARLLEAAELLHGHGCPPLTVGVRAGAFALERLEVARAADRQLFAFVEMSGDHYGQGFGDGVQVVTGCTFGKDNIARVPLGKLGLTLLDQRRDRAVRIAARREFLDGLESTDWFRRASRTGAPWAEAAGGDLEAVRSFLLSQAPEALFSASPVFPMGVEHAPPGFVTAPCEGCGESVLSPYLTDRGGRRLCARCDGRASALGQVPPLKP
jgi:formylmethanofuran dehydrogenase subunit E